ncbi:MAG: hypothetical protein Q9M97_07050 [Candidatus Gracilibacteria bacterium]|nr:hypothetical protein [Candidatus Gracilibacteria bacterium]
MSRHGKRNSRRYGKSLMKRDNITDISIDFGPAFISGVTKSYA